MEKWKAFRLLEEERTVIEINDDIPSNLLLKEQRSLMGKFCSTRMINREVLGTMMAKIWRISKAAQFTEVSPTIFVILFENIADKQRV